jgi:hypothetical protein
MKRICIACGSQSQNGTQLLENTFVPNSVKSPVAERQSGSWAF